MQTIDFRLFRHLWMFLAVAEELHFGRAARRLGMSQPPLTEQIKVLERSLGLTLFNRSRRGTALSPAGAALLPAVRQFAAQVERLEQVVREVAAGHSGVLRIGAISAAMLETVPIILAGLRELHPNLTVTIQEIDSAEALHALEAGELDIAFARIEGKAGPSIASLPLTEDRLGVALQLDHPLSNLREVPLGALAGGPMVMSSRRVSPIYFDMLTALCRNKGFSPRILHEVRSVMSQIAYVGCGQGLALVPTSTSRLAPTNVVVRPLEDHIMVVTAALVWDKRRVHPILDTIVAISTRTAIPSFDSV